MKTPETEPTPQMEELISQARADATLARMLKMSRPLTVATYVRMSWPGKEMSELGAEELASIPDGLTNDLPAASKADES